MHPGNHARAVLIRVCFVEGGANHAAGQQGGLQQQREGQKVRGIDLVHHDARVLGDVPEALVPVQIL